MSEQLERMGLRDLYRALGWPTDPEDPRAVERFRAIAWVMERLVERGVFDHVLGEGRARILDVMAASGICGAALAMVLASRGVRVSLTLTDLREEELGRAHRWLERAGLEGKAALTTLVADAEGLPRLLGGEAYDVATVWGSSLPHLDSYGLMMLLSGIRELQEERGVLLLEQASLLPRILVSNDFRHVLVEGDVLTVFKEYDDLRGVQRRLAYRLPGLEYMGLVETRLWETSQIASAAWVFYRNVEVYDHAGPPPTRRTRIIVASRPRETAPSWSELAASRPRPAGILEPSGGG